MTKTQNLNSPKKSFRQTRIFEVLRVVLPTAIITLGFLITLPVVFVYVTHREESLSPATAPQYFPVTVDPARKIIVENPQVNAYLESAHSPLQAAVWNTESAFMKAFALIATTIADTSWYQSLGAVNGRLVAISPGMRKEQVASAFASVLGWNAEQKRTFLTTRAAGTLPLFEGSYSPGLYVVDKSTGPLDAQNLVNDRFRRDVLSHYSTSTAEKISVVDALTIASLIERETIGTTDMRLISGIIWNRLFLGMKLQVDATVQYAKANDATVSNWWPKVLPKDTSRRSPYNTYLHEGLPPTPIANPSVAAILAALNPINTSCLYYFNDQTGVIHCTDTYAEHVALLKKYYGQGK